MTSVKGLNPADQDLAVDVIVRAFSKDPVAQWFYPELEQYREYFPKFVRAFAGAAFAHGRVHCIDGFLGAALWLAPGAHVDGDILASLLQQSIGENRKAEAFALIEQMEQRHPPEAHWYLPMIGVDPAHHSQGYGSVLLKHALARCDRAGKPSYLEASSTASARLYERHGFEPLGTIQVGSSPPLFPMLRRPRPN